MLGGRPAGRDGEASRASTRNTAPMTSISAAATQNGAASPHRSAMLGAVSPAMTVPPMPMP